MGERLCSRCIGQGKDTCPVPGQLDSLHKRSESRTIPRCKPGLDPESFSPAQREQQQILAEAISNSCPYVAQEVDKTLKNNKRQKSQTSAQ